MPHFFGMYDVTPSLGGALRTAVRSIGLKRLSAHTSPRITSRATMSSENYYPLAIPFGEHTSAATTGKCFGFRRNDLLVGPLVRISLNTPLCTSGCNTRGDGVSMERVVASATGCPNHVNWNINGNAARVRLEPTHHNPTLVVVVFHVNFPDINLYTTQRRHQCVGSRSSQYIDSP